MMFDYSGRERFTFDLNKHGILMVCVLIFICFDQGRAYSVKASELYSVENDLLQQDQQQLHRVYDRLYKLLDERNNIDSSSELGTDNAYTERVGDICPNSCSTSSSSSSSSSNSAVGDDSMQGPLIACRLICVLTYALRNGEVDDGSLTKSHPQMSDLGQLWYNLQNLNFVSEEDAMPGEERRFLPPPSPSIRAPMTPSFPEEDAQGRGEASLRYHRQQNEKPIYISRRQENRLLSCQESSCSGQGGIRLRQCTWDKCRRHMPRFKRHLPPLHH